jgi:hypothetical protein
MIAELVDGQEYQLPIWGRKELIDDVPKYAFPRARCEHGDILARRVRREGWGMYVFHGSTIKNWTLSYS